MKSNSFITMQSFVAYTENENAKETPVIQDDDYCWVASIYCY